MAAGTLLGVLLIASAAGQTAVVRKIQPLRGSLMGGTEITITGAGFADDEWAGAANLVFVNSQACSILKFFTTETRLVCVTPAYLDHDTRRPEATAGGETANFGGAWQVTGPGGATEIETDLIVYVDIEEHKGSPCTEHASACPRIMNPKQIHMHMI